MQEQFSMCIPINSICHTNKMKDKNHMIISIDAGKVLIKVSTNQLQERDTPQYIKEGHVYQAPPNTILKGERLRTFPLGSGTRQGCPLSSLLVNSTGSPNQRNQARKTKVFQIGQGNINLFVNDMILCIKSLNTQSKSRSMNSVKLQDMKFQDT